ncbi:MAG TPA: N-acetyl-gamma-glutamyl-phosphate reductase [Chloroflexota bacterium]|jgi:N-acetyl-gamma-glutamyl-phosphate reductase|nr:N-acetyl-gamma-glutamyl-phosphate reductase [Chloroflexota bacterium]
MRKRRFRAQIVGATGYGGLGMTEQLVRHPEIEITALLAKTDVGKPISDFFPHLRGFCDRVVEEAHEDRVGQEADVVIFSTPDRVSMAYAPRLYEAGIAVLDYSGDFRFRDPGAYERYAKRQPSVAGKPHACPELLPRSAYGVPELFRDELRRARLVGNPGCFSVAMELALAPALKAGLIDARSIVVDGKTGISGAGKKPTPTFHFPERVENVTPYRVAAHQHGTEAAEQLGRYAVTSVGLTFVPHLVPISRGIECTCYAQLVASTSADRVQELYAEAYRCEPFVRVLPRGVAPGPKAVHGSNLCDLSLFVDDENDRLVVVASIDNLLKGQAGMALQNINLMLGLEETLGLDRIPLYP